MPSTIRLFIAIFFFTTGLFLAGCQKQEKLNLPPLTNRNVKEELIKFGKENPETEVLISTSLGEIKVKLYTETPLHRANFIRLIKMGYYDNKVFNRVIKGHMAQGADSRDEAEKKRVNIGEYGIPSEVNTKFYHKRGALAMARYDDEFNPTKASSSDNFYLVQGTVATLSEIQDVEQRYHIKYTPEQIKTYTTIGGVPTLDSKYTVFGEVTEGLEVVDKIANFKTDTHDWPIKDIYMTMKVLD
ncbi:peptidylprolyl isomerase [Adhaeribacter aquaticus]|uniref:peptidylprolyl isomerase n=1 Tax=Adhaeribacter aquaticus TaxID=299567 RepID=UPI0006846B37|nr:peptidylprolyl isomerase [Adhaeribacter aquaticus]